MREGLFAITYSLEVTILLDVNLDGLHLSLAGCNVAVANPVADLVRDTNGALAASQTLAWVVPVALASSDSGDEGKSGGNDGELHVESC